MSGDVEQEVLLEKVRELENKDTATRLSENTADVLHERRILSEPLTDAEARKAMSRHTRRSFLVGGIAAIAGLVGWRSISDDTKVALYRRAFEFNETVSELFYSPSRLAPEFGPDKISPPRTNGMIGLTDEIDPSQWTLTVAGIAGGSGELVLTIDDVKKLPRIEMTTEFKCIEGWSIVVNWAGARFSDFAAKYPPATRNGSSPDLHDRPVDLMPYVALSSPNNEYYVGWDMPSILHPQTLLAYEMNGSPLTSEHGAPLRLASATKYGYKQLKRIARIEYTAERPPDYWAERGYDWYAGH